MLVINASVRWLMEGKVKDKVLWVEEKEDRLLRCEE